MPLLPVPPPQPPPKAGSSGRRGNGKRGHGGTSHRSDVDTDVEVINYAAPISKANIQGIEACMATLQKLSKVYEPVANDYEEDPDGTIAEYGQLSEVMGFSQRLISYLYVLVNLLSKRVAAHDAKDTNQETEYHHLQQQMDELRKDNAQWKGEVKHLNETAVEASRANGALQLQVDEAREAQVAAEDNARNCTNTLTREKEARQRAESNAEAAEAENEEKDRVAATLRADVEAANAAAKQAQDARADAAELEQAQQAVAAKEAELARVQAERAAEASGSASAAAKAARQANGDRVAASLSRWLSQSTATLFRHWLSFHSQAKLADARMAVADAEAAAAASAQDAASAKDAVAASSGASDEERSAAAAELDRQRAAVASLEAQVALDKGEQARVEELADTLAKERGALQEQLSAQSAEMRALEEVRRGEEEVRRGEEEKLKSEFEAMKAKAADAERQLVSREAKAGKAADDSARRQRQREKAEDSELESRNKMAGKEMLLLQGQCDELRVAADRAREDTEHEKASHAFLQEKRKELESDLEKERKKRKDVKAALKDKEAELAQRDTQVAQLKKASEAMKAKYAKYDREEATKAEKPLLECVAKQVVDGSMLSLTVFVGRLEVRKKGKKDILYNLKYDEPGGMSVEPNAKVKEGVTVKSGALRQPLNLLTGDRDAIVNLISQHMKAVQPAVSAVSASIITPAQTQYLRTHQLDEAKIILATAQYDHETEDARMLPLKAGAVVVVTEEVQGWWKAVDSEGREGLVPPAYMKEIEKG